MRDFHQPLFFNYISINICLEIFVGGIHHELIWVYIIGDIIIFRMRIHQQWRYRWGFTIIFSMGISHQWDTGNHGEMAPWIKIWNDYIHMKYRRSEYSTMSLWERVCTEKLTMKKCDGEVVDFMWNHQLIWEQNTGIESFTSGCNGWSTSPWDWTENLYIENLCRITNHVQVIDDMTLKMKGKDLLGEI